MKFTKFGKTLLMTAISAGIILGIGSCTQSFTVGYLYVTGTNNAAASNNGIISGFRIDHNRGGLTPLNGLPVASGGANPGRAVLLTGGRFLYVLNRGANSSGTANCTQASPCNGANITQFAIGGNGILTPQETFFTQGINPTRIVADTTTSSFLYVLDSIAPDQASCALALGAGTTSCGDITVFKIDSNTGRLSLVVNAQVTAANGQPLTYFPVPANPIDFVLASTFVLTLSGTPSTGDLVFPYSVANGQLTLNQNSVQPLGIKQATGIVNTPTAVYVLDNEGTLVQNSTIVKGAVSQLLPFTVGTNGALQQQTGGAVPIDSTLSNPVYMIQESKGKFVYIANAGNNANTINSQSGISGYIIDKTTNELNQETNGSPYGTGAAPQCIIEDPSNQFIYTANFGDSSITGHTIDQNAGTLTTLPGSANRTYALSGPAAWCLVTGRTN